MKNATKHQQSISKRTVAGPLYWLFILSFLFLFGCKSSVEYQLDAMQKPIYIVAISQTNGVLLRDSKGHVLQLPGSYYMAKSIMGSGLKNGDVLIPAGER